jgi:hypothetical protein
MNILRQLIRNLPLQWQNRGEIPSILKQKLYLELQDCLQVSCNTLMPFAFCPTQQQCFQEMNILHQIFIQDHQSVIQKPERFPLIRLVSTVLYYPPPLESLSWSLTSLFYQFSIAPWILPIRIFSIYFCAECIASENHTVSQYRHICGEGV